MTNSVRCGGNYTEKSKALEKISKVEVAEHLARRVGRTEVRLRRSQNGGLEVVGKLLVDYLPDCLPDC